MKIRNICLAAVMIVLLPAVMQASILFDDDFNDDIASSRRWHIPTWQSPTDGTYIGRTQFRVSQNSPLPSADNGNVRITVESYNPTGLSFYGTDLISNQAFLPSEEGLRITVRAKMENSTPGIAGGIFLYALTPGSTTLHDEIDFEFLTTAPHGVETNIYANEPLGTGHPRFIPYLSGSITDYHTYEILWQTSQVTWLVDGRTVRTESSHVPTQPMNLHLNVWVPGSEWLEGYSADLQPVSSPDSNRIFTMSVDSVSVEYLVSKEVRINPVPVVHFLLSSTSPPPQPLSGLSR